MVKDTDAVGLIVALVLVVGGLLNSRSVPQTSPPVPPVAPLVQPQPWTPDPTPVKPVVPTPKPPPRP